MIDLTPLDVRKKKGDFRRGMRGYDPMVVDDFLDMVAERMEQLVRENAALRERATGLSDGIERYREREQAMNEALVSAQQLREDMRTQSAKDSEIALREARAEGERLVGEARRQIDASAESLRRMRAQRSQFLRGFRDFVERQLLAIEDEEARLQSAAGIDGVRASHADEAARPGESTAPRWLAEIEEEEASE